MSSLDDYKTYDPDKIAEMCDYSQECLNKSGLGIYQTETDLVQVRRLKDLEEATVDGVTRQTGALIVEQIPKLLLHEMLECAPFKFRKLNSKTRRMGWQKGRAPEKLSAHILQRKGRWTFPLLTGIIQAPTLLPDGRVLKVNGYDAKSGLYLDTNGVTFPDVPNKPTMDDARDAIARLKEPFLEFPFDDADEDGEGKLQSPGLSVVLAAIMTGVTRQNYPTAPAFALDASAPGSGKTMLWNSVAIIVTGYDPAAMVYTGKDEEDEKRLHASLIAKDQVLFLDNINKKFEGAAISAVLTKEHWKSRFLGVTSNVGVSTKTLILLNGNNLEASYEVARRLVAARIVPLVANPRTRAGFTYDLSKYVPEHRPQLVVDALTVLRAFYKAGCPQDHDRPAFGSFNEWDRIVRGALLWLGEPDPCITTALIEGNNYDQNNLEALLTAIGGQFGNKWVTARDVYEAATDEMQDRSLKYALENIECGSAKLLGRYLAKNLNTVAGDWRIRRSQKPDRNKNWRYRADLVSEFG